MIVKIDDAQTPADFTREYASTVDDVEAQLVGEALEAMAAIDIDTAAEKLSQAGKVRSRYLALLELSATDPQHPLSSSISKLRDNAVDMAEFRQTLQTVCEAFLEYRRGNGSNALRMLDNAHTYTRVPEPDSFLSYQMRITGEGIAGLIRRGVLDYAGARAAYDRAAAIGESLLAELSEEFESSEDDEQKEFLENVMKGVKFTKLGNEANSLQMQYAQLMENRDYAGAVDAARASSKAYLEAANEIGAFMPIVAPIIRSASFSTLADAGIAEGNILLEQKNWDAASDLIKTVRDYYQVASRECLKSRHPSASMLQEQYLNLSVSWMTRFRRELDRERSHAARLEELQIELRNFLGGMRGALAPAGVVVNTSTEMVTSVKQHVEVTNRVEANVRSLLREIPDALTAVDLPPSARAQLSAEALQLAEDTGDRGSFFARVGIFSQKLATAISKGAELAAPVAALLKALSIVG